LRSKKQLKTSALPLCHPGPLLLKTFVFQNH